MQKTKQQLSEGGFNGQHQFGIYAGSEMNLFGSGSMASSHHLVGRGMGNICGFMKTDKAGRIVFVSGNIVPMLGSATDIHDCFVLDHDCFDNLLDDLEVNGGRYQSVLARRNYPNSDIVCHAEIIRTDDSFLWLIAYRSGNGEGVCELDLTRDKLRMILDHAPIGIWMQNGCGKLEFVNKSFCAATGISEAEFLSVGHYKELIPKDYLDICLSSDEKALASDGPTVTLQQLPFVDGYVHDLQVLKAVRRNADGKPIALIGLALDITDQRRQEVALQKAQACIRERAIAEETARLLERQHIAQCLHDDLGQTLTSLSLRIDGILSSSSSLEIASQLTAMRTLIEEAVASTRHLTTLLRPPIALERGLTFAVKKLVDRLNMPGTPNIRINFPEEGLMSVAESSEIVLVLYRLYQEGLTNILRHARAKHVVLNLHISDGNIIASIEDDGEGFLPDSLKYSHGIGLLGLKERVEMVGGTFSINSAPGNGTTLSIQLPNQLHDNKHSDN